MCHRLMHEFMRYKRRKRKRKVLFKRLRMENDSTYTRVYIDYFFIHIILLIDTQMNDAKMG